MTDEHWCGDCRWWVQTEADEIVGECHFNPVRRDGWPVVPRGDIGCSQHRFDRECPHGNRAGECNDCDVESDIAYDMGRERGMF